MGKKYIAELPDSYILNRLNENKFLQVPIVLENGDDAVIRTVIPITPYTEPDLEQVRKEAYEEGRNSLLIEVQKAGKNTIKLEDDEYYQRGLADAWEAARKIAFNKARGGLTYRELETIFGTDEMTEILDMSASEAIEKIRQYEQKQEEIQVWDEVKVFERKPFIVTGFGYGDDDAVYCHGFVTENGISISAKKDECVKTGRHFPKIAEVLQKMRERSEQDDKRNA